MKRRLRLEKLRLEQELEAEKRRIEALKTEQDESFEAMKVRDNPREQTSSRKNKSQLRQSCEESIKIGSLKGP